MLIMFIPRFKFDVHFKAAFERFSAYRKILGNSTFELFSLLIATGANLGFSRGGGAGFRTFFKYSVDFF